MLVKIQTCVLQGVDAIPVDVEVDVASGHLPRYQVVGLAASSARDSAVRVRAALEHEGQPMPKKQITANLAPGRIPKSGPAFDLPLAIGMCVGDGRLPNQAVNGLLFLGELGLDGSLRAISGTLSAALLARNLGLRGIVVPEASAGEAAMAKVAPVFGYSSFGTLFQDLKAGTLRETIRSVPQTLKTSKTSNEFDLADIAGIDEAKMAVEVAVAGGHNLFLVGPPGAGKTLLARSIPSLLPAASKSERIEMTKIYSSMQMTNGELVIDRPFRSPHHTASSIALVGGGRPVCAGEVSLAHRGVLFLDELPEFSRDSLEALRQPLEDREVHISRAQGRFCYPASFMLVAAANPCPCGFLGSEKRSCCCSLRALERYRNKLSGPLMDRMDMQAHIAGAEITELRRAGDGEKSEKVRERIVAAREIQSKRLRGFGKSVNAEMHVAELRKTCNLTTAAEQLLRQMSSVFAFSGRGVHRLLRVARTVADLKKKNDIDEVCLLEAASYRNSVIREEVESMSVTPAALESPPMATTG